MKSAIISGAGGFIGNAVARYLIGQGVKVTAVVKPGTTYSQEAFRLKGLNAHIIECDLREMNRLPDMVRRQKYNAFYQLAWDGLDKDSMLDYKQQIDNIKWGVESIEVAANLGCKKYIGAGSVTQLELLNPQGCLFTGDRHKYFRAAQLACEAIGRAAAKEKGIQFIWPIIINVYGEGEIAARLVNSMIRNLLEKKYQAFSPGEQLYDFLHIEDAARAFYLIGEKGKEGRRYIIGSGEPKPLKQYLETIRDVVAPNEKLGLGDLPFNGFEMTDEMLDISLLAADTGFAPRISFEEGIKRTLKWIIGEETDGNG